MNADDIVALVVDDDQGSLDHRMELLEACGFSAIGAATAEEAIRKFENTRVDIVVTDIRLSPGVGNDRSGVDLARAVRKRDPNVPIIGYSAAFSEVDLKAEEWDVFSRRFPKGSISPREILGFVTDWKMLAAQYCMLRPRRKYNHLELLRVSGKPLFLYSTNTLLAFRIGRDFFGDEHYVWCTPEVDSSSKSKYDATVPPSSSPMKLYHALAEAVRMGDLHCDKISANRQGILKGAQIRRACGDITSDQLTEIERIVHLAGLQDFEPLMYIIPIDKVAHLLKKVPVDQRAALFSSEYIIERLPRKCFEYLTFF